MIGAPIKRGLPMFAVGDTCSDLDVTLIDTENYAGALLRDVARQVYRSLGHPRSSWHDVKCLTFPSVTACNPKEVSCRRFSIGSPFDALRYRRPIPVRFGQAASREELAVPFPSVPD